MNKKAIELSVNFLVILILSLAIFGGGIFLVYQIYTKTADLKGAVDSQTQERIDSALESGDKVTIPYTTKDVSRGELADFAVGINNERTTETAFYVKAVFSQGKAGSTLISTDPGGLLQDTAHAYLLKPNTHATVRFGVVPPKTTVPGTYIYTVTVTYDPGTSTPVAYDSPMKVYVTVK